MDLKEETILGSDASKHWYYISKGYALLQFIHGIAFSYVLDVGAGSGIFSKLLLDRTGAASAVCCDIGYTRNRAEHYAGKPLYFQQEITRSDADLVLFLDVLEHTADDVQFIKQYADKLNPGAHIVVTVPAFQFLFSGHDLFLNHYRRYTIATLEQCLTAAGLRVLKSRYYFLMLFPPIAMIRLITRIRLALGGGDVTPETNLRPHTRAINAILTAINRAELVIFPFNRLAGMTVFSLAVKQ